MTSDNSERVRVRAAGKINLALRVGALAPDGYHPLVTIFQAVSVFDEVTVVSAAAGAFSVTVSGDQAALVPLDDTNLAIKAARLLAAEFEVDAGAHIAIKKAIPVGGGMAGGSADAAATLLACSVLWQLDVSPDELRELGSRLGADVPFSLLGGSAVGTGHGDELVPALSRGAYHWVLALSEGELATPQVYRRFDELGVVREPLDVPADLMNGLAAGDPGLVGPALINDLQPAAVSLRPQLQRILDVGMDLGALGAVVSGSGPTVAFLTPDESAAIDMSVQLSAAGVCKQIKRVAGPVPGARLLT